MSGKQFKQQDTERSVAKLAEASIELMIQILMRREDAFCAVRNQLTPAIFRDYTEDLYALWSVLCEYHAVHEQLPNFTTLQAELKSFCSSHPDIKLDDEELQGLILFCRKAHQMKAIQLDTNWAIKKVRQFLDERLLDKTKRLLDDDQRRPSDLPAFLRKLHVASEEISSIQGTTTGSAFPTNWTPTPLALMSTGIDFLDEFMGDGDASGEVNSVLGPTGSCKTTLALQLACKRAQQYWLRTRDNPSLPQHMVYFVPYESPVEPELRQRILVCHAAVLRKSMETCKNGWDSLSSMDSPKGYEQELFKDQLQRGTFRGERERIEDSMIVLNKALKWIDCSGGDPANPNRGGGFVDELVNILTNDLRNNPNTRVGTVIIDYAGVMVTKHLARTGQDYGQLRHHLGNLPMQLRDRIALPMQASVWLMHQLSGAANSKSVWAGTSHTDSQECKTIGDNCSFAFALGNVDINGHCVIQCTKHRRQPRHSRRIIRVDGAMGRVRSTTGDHYYDERSKQIVNVNDVQKIEALAIENARPAARQHATFDGANHAP